MNVADKIGVLVPFLNWHPVVVGLFFFFIYGFVIKVVLMGLVERRFKRPHWNSFKYAAVLHPIYFGLAAYAIQNSEVQFSGFYTKPWFHLVALVAGIALALNAERDAMKKGVYTWKQELMPSKLYHTFMFAFIAWMVVVTVIPLAVMIHLDSTILFAYACMALAVQLCAIGIGLGDGKLIATGRYPRGTH